jgi:2-polyprenyl-3-methyl-5-hydroxy-6-metoxy-1,4-benzoquinol methylase
MALIDEGNTTKPDFYYGVPRTDLLESLTAPVGRVLDLGCGYGLSNDALRASGATHITGVELMPEPAAVAAKVYDRVEIGDALEVLNSLEETYDTILCYDVLEHLMDANAVLRRLRELAAPGATIQISIPNARFIKLPLDLIFRGTFGYTEYGHRDNTHLRWWTSRDMIAALENAGFSNAVDQAAITRHRYGAILHKLTFGYSSQFGSVQWYFRATAG